MIKEFSRFFINFDPRSILENFGVNYYVNNLFGFGELIRVLLFSFFKIVYFQLL